MDAVSFVDVLEKVSAASYQLLVGSYSDASLRKESIKMGTAASQRSATIVLLSAGVPDGVLSPALVGGSVAPDAEGFTPAYAIDTRFGPLVPFQLQVGAPNDLGVRFKVNYETPSDNSYIYEGMTCEPGATSSEPPSASAVASQGSIAGSVPIATTSDTSPPGSRPGMSPGATEPPPPPDRPANDFHKQNRAFLHDFAPQNRGSGERPSLRGDGESAGWPRHGNDRVEESRDSIGQGAGESQVGVT